MTEYRYQVQGRAADNESWFTTGKVTANGGGAFMPAVQEAMRKSFVDLTNGQAVYGSPGKGCSGPYRITSLALSEVPVNGERSWFKDEAKPGEVYIGCGVFAEFSAERSQLVKLRYDGSETLTIDSGSVNILYFAYIEWKERNGG